jgi:hypothetical protein
MAAIGAVVLTGLVFSGRVFNMLVDRWLPVAPDEVRPARSNLGCGLGAAAFGAGLCGIGLFGQWVWGDPTWIAALMWAPVFLIPGLMMVGWWASRRIWVGSEGLQTRSWRGVRRAFGWSEVTRIRGRYWFDLVVVEMTTGKPIRLHAQSEGLEALFDMAWRRSIPFENFEPFVKAGRMVLPDRP